MRVCGHGVVELGEEGGVFFWAVLFGEAERLDAFDEDLGGVGLSFDEVDGFADVVGEGHGAWIGCLSAAREFGLDVRRDYFNDLYVRGFELVAEGLGPGVDGGLGGVVGRRYRQGDEGEAGGDSEDGCVGLLFQVREQGPR